MNSRYVLSISYGNYMLSVGGTDKVILTHQKMFAERNISYVFLFPLNLSNSRPVRDNKYWGVMIDGKFVRTLHTDHVINFLFSLEKKGHDCQCIHIHHLRNINMDALENIVSAIQAMVYFYIHDYYNICVSTNLISSTNKTFCSFGRLDPGKCIGCQYYEKSCKHERKFLEFVERIKNRLLFICPSPAAEKQFLKGFPELTGNTAAIYHQKLKGSYGRKTEANRPLKIAYVGSPLPHKGWSQFLKIADHVSDRDLYEFYYFGKTSVDHSRIRHIYVDFKQELNAMVNALRRENIDLVLLWSVWPETYAYTYYESLAAECFIVTNRNSGNIAFQVQERKNGIVLADDAELLDFFRDRAAVEKCVTDYLTGSHCVPDELIENDDIVKLALENGPGNCSGESPGRVFSLPEIIINGLYKRKISRRNT